MPYVNLPTKAKNDAAGFQHFNNIKNNLDYLKAQTEVLVAENASTPTANVIPESTLQISNSPQEGGLLTSRAAETGGLTWSGLHSLADFWALQ